MHQRMRQMKKDSFYDLLQRVTDEIPRHDMIMMIGDWNAKIGAPQEGEDGVVGQHGLGEERSENGVRFVSFCAANNLARHVQYTRTDSVRNFDLRSVRTVKAVTNRVHLSYGPYDSFSSPGLLLIKDGAP